MSITSSTWDPAQYLKFSNERVRPAFDLLAQVPLDTAARVVDLGCGTGNMTGILKQRFPGAEVLGVDGAETMLEKARAGAVSDVRTRAEIYARAAGVTLGPILSISEGGGEVRPLRMAAPMVFAAKSVPVAAGEESVTADVSVVWEIH